MKILTALAFLLATSVALAEGEAPPSTHATERMQELHRILYDARTSPEDRRRARAELMQLLRARDAKVPPREMPPRAAIIPTPNAVIGTQRNPPAATVVGPTLAPLAPPASATLDPATGSVLTPSGRAAIDSRTGRIVNEVPGGYVDPATGRFIPKP